MVAVTYTLADLVADVRDIVKEGGPDRAMADRVQACLERALRSPDFLESCPGYTPQAGNLRLYKDPDLGFIIGSSVMEPGFLRMPHDHGAIRWSIYGTYSNSFVQRLWRRTDDGSQPGRASVEVAEEVTVPAGRAYALLPGDIHQDLNLSDKPAVSIIIRERDNRETPRDVFYPERGLVKTPTGGTLLYRSRQDVNEYFAEELRTAGG
jgi:hypothetical protein